MQILVGDRPRGVLFGTIASLAVLVIGCDAGPRPRQEGLSAADGAYARFELEEATEGFRGVYDDGEATAADRAEAARRLAAIRRLIHDDPDGAREWADRAEAIADRPFETGVERVRQHLAAEDWTDAALAGRALRQAADTSLEAGRAAGLFLRATWRGLFEATVSGTRLDEALLVEAHDVARRTLGTDWGRLDLSRAAVGAALAADDGPTAFEAWSSYFQWDGPDDRRHISATAAAIEPLLATWRGPDADRDDRRGLVRALVDSRMHRAAAWVALDGRVPPARRIDAEPDIRALLAYERFRQRVAAAAAHHYRLRALGDPFSSELARGFDEAGAELWSVMRPGDEAYRRDRLLEEARRRFGAEIHFRGPQGRNLNYGHWVVDRELDVEQYGRSASFRFVRLDFMVSNGFNSWFWDGGAATGGWAQDDTIVQIRPAYARGPVDAWLAVTDDVERRRRDEEIARLAPLDDEAARTNPHGYFEGLRLRLRRQARERLLAELRGRDLEGSALRRAFIRELSRRTFESSIVAHEGRHAIDRRTQPIVTMMRRDSEKEYRAKLSEVAFAPDPRVALIGGIVSSNIGADTAHGQANARIMRELVEWMRAHEAEIEGLDEDPPLLPQLDRLTDEQIRSAFRAMDPWA